MKKKIKVSVIMAIYNGRSFLNEQLYSIMKQTHKVDEMIIIDDCSHEECDDIINIYQKKYNMNINYQKHQVNKGYARTFFDALELATGDIIFFSDQDDIWMENKIEIMLNKIIDNPEILCLSSMNNIIDHNGHLIKKDKKYKKTIKCIALEELIKQSALRPGMSLAIKKELKEMLSNWDISELKEHDRFVEFVACLYKGYFLTNEYLTNYRIHDKNTSGINLSLKPRTDKKGRIRQIDKEIYYLDILLKGNITRKTRKMILRYKKYYLQRKMALQGNVFTYHYKMFLYMKYYNNFKIWAGDILSLLLN